MILDRIRRVLGGRRSKEADPGESRSSAKAAGDPTTIANLVDMQMVSGFFAVFVGIGFFVLAGYSVLAGEGRPYGPVLWGVALLVAGMSVGFLFGIPKVKQRDADAGKDRAAGAAGADRSGEPADRDSAAEPRRRASASAYRQNVNTNLEEISDWLTKIIVGIGLVELKEIPRQVLDLATRIGASLGTTEAHASFGLAVAILFPVLGFLYGYLMTRIYLQGALVRAESQLNTLEEKIHDLEQREQEVQKELMETDRKANAALTSLAPTVPRQPEAEATDAAAEAIWDSDPLAGFAQGKSEDGGRRLTASIVPVHSSPGLHRVHLEIVPTDPSKPLRPPVVFHLHPTFPRKKAEVKIDSDGRARYDLLAWEAFTVGAEADDGNTLLELDLNKVTGGDRSFYY